MWHQRHNWWGWGSEYADYIYLNCKVTVNGQLRYGPGGVPSQGAAGASGLYENEFKYYEGWTSATVGLVRVDYDWAGTGNGTQVLKTELNIIITAGQNIGKRISDLKSGVATVVTSPLSQIFKLVFFHKAQFKMTLLTPFWKTASCILFLATFICTNIFAQNQQIRVIDSLLAKGMIRSTVQSFYIKPLVEQYNSLVSVEGTGFSAPQGDLLRKRGFGIRLGYRWRHYELETGLSTIRPAAGIRYLLNYPGFGHITRVRSTDFQQIPIVFRYRFWQPTKHLSLRVGAGIAYNTDLNKMSLAPTSTNEDGTLDANGNKIVLARFRSQYDKVKSFFSGEVNVSAQYQLSTRFSASLEAKRLISAMEIVSYNATQETFNPPAFNKVESRGGANSYSVNLGMAYQFGFRNRYHLRD